MKETIRYAWGQSTLGEFIVAVSGRGLVAVEFGDSRTRLKQDLLQRFADADAVEEPTALVEVIGKVVARIEQPHSDGELALDLRGSDFELRVWQALRGIPAGETASYGDIAARLGLPGMAREVGQACAANTIAVLVPCHRVVKKDGSLSGYRWGVPRKRALLEQEARA